MNGLQVSHHISSRVGETSIFKPTTTSPWLSQARKQHFTKPVLWVNGSRHVLWATTSQKWKQTDQNGFKYSRKERQGDLPVRQTSLQLTWPHITASTSSFRASFGKTCFEQSRETAQFIHSFAQRPELRSMQAHESYESAKVLTGSDQFGGAAA